MPSLMCSALYSRRSIRNLGHSSWGRRRSNDTGKSRRGLFDWEPPVWGTSELYNETPWRSSLILSTSFPLGHWIPSIRSWFLTQPLRTSGKSMVIYPFVMRSSFLQKLLLFWQRTFKQSHLPFLRHCLFFFFLNDYLVRHKETTRLCL